ncbi:MAG: hypothetical protein O2930_13505 [Acidobacteria bacterium]|nr:hypothetical protein [Acidobacteriota bacterium]
MTRSLVALTTALLTTAVYAQQPPQSPTQAETLAKWPWSISLQAAPFARQSIEITLAPLEGMEYKYRLDEDAGMLYSWTSTGEVHWELHSQPDDAPQGYAEFFDTSDGNGSHGGYTAPFSGIHGWWWENTTDADVTITLTTAGFYTESHEFRRGQPVEITAIE